MKKILCILIVSILTICTISAENVFYIVKINGVIIKNDNSENLIQGDKIDSSTTYKIIDKKVSAVLIDEKGNFFWFKVPEQLSYNENKEIIVSANACISPIHEINSGSKRGFKKIEIKKSVNNLKKYFGEDKFTVLGDTLSFKLDKNIYPLNNDKFIVFYYKINNVQVSKKVGFENHYLKIEKAKLFSSNGQTQDGNILKNVFVYQYERSTGKVELLTKINLIFISPTNLEKEFRVILKAVNQQNYSLTNKKQLLTNYFSNIYGLCDGDRFSDFLNNSLTK